MDAPELLWQPSPQRVEKAGITQYLRCLEAERGLRFDGYEALWRWSVTDLESFWDSIWKFCRVIGHAPYHRVLDRRAMPGARWFEGATLNYAEHTLRHAARTDQPAIVFTSEIRERTEISWPSLAATAGALAGALDRLGVVPGDRVVAYLPNIPESAMALFAAASRGAVWSSCSPEMGIVSVLDRFHQIGPKVLFAVDGYRYGGKSFDRRELVRDLVRQLPTVEAVVLVPYLNAGASLDAIVAGDHTVPVVPFAQAIATPMPVRFLPVPFDHPLWVVYSSGTSGLPKPIVHGHGGVLLENLKAAAMHLDVGPDDRFFWFSSTNWIMWNLWVSMLASGCTGLQFDGNPAHPDATTLWRFAERERATFFGISPAFVTLCMKAGLRPREQLDLAPLRTVGATGSPLSEEAYRWVYQHVHPDVLLASISGGTDPCAAFLTSCPTLPVYAGEMQCRALGVAVQAFDDAGKPLSDEVGELVITEPMPSMPLRFWGDEDGVRYRESYFEMYPGVWRHGDWLRLIPRPESTTGIIYGRSDSTINRYGIRMGTSEIYRVVESFPDVADALVIDLEYLGRPSFMALFVVLAGRPHTEDVPPDLRARILDAIRTKLSARHVPDDVIAIPEVPRTLSGKKMEVPVKRILLGHPVEKCASRDSMSNPTSLDWFIELARRRAQAQ